MRTQNYRSHGNIVDAANAIIRNDARVQVNFCTAGMKWLALSVAKLTPL